MDDPSRFTSINEYYTFIYAISYMMLVELGIWIYNFKGWLKRPDKKNNGLHPHSISSSKRLRSF